MLRALFNKLTGGQITAIILAMIFVPGAVGAAVTFQAVAIVDPSTGRQSHIDVSRNLRVYDPIAGYENNPLNYVNLSVSSIGDGSTHILYTPPAGKALIVKSFNATYFSGKAGIDNYVYLSETSVSSNFYITGFDSSAVNDAINTSLGNGYYIHEGSSLAYATSSSLPFALSVQGFLVPSYAVPPIGSQAATEQAAHIGSLKKP